MLITIVKLLSSALPLPSLELPDVDPVRHSETSLDIHLRARRRRELDEVKKAMQGLDTSDPQQAVNELESVLARLENLAQEVRKADEVTGHCFLFFNFFFIVCSNTFPLSLHFYFETGLIQGFSLPFSLYV